MPYKNKVSNAMVDCFGEEDNNKCSREDYFDEYFEEDDEVENNIRR